MRQSAAACVVVVSLLLPAMSWALCVFAWDAPLLFVGGPVDPNAIQYRLYDSPTPGGPYALRQTIPAPATDNAASPIACTLGTYWVVTAINADDPVGESPNSNEVFVTPTSTQLVLGRVVIQGKASVR